MSTIILECNKKIKLEDGATDGEIRRIIDFLFESKFTENDDDVNEDEKVYKANKNILNDDFLDKYKYAFIDILMTKAHKFLTEQKEEFVIPKCVADRTREYISQSYIYLEYLKDVCEYTGDKDDYVQVKDIFEMIKNSELFKNSDKKDKRMMTKKLLIDFYMSNSETCKHYKDRLRSYDDGKQLNLRNVLTGYKFIEEL